ncbi:MAG: hypothetical protein A2Y41_06010 [Spirochaetes bacterium GWB1_36_13]|nr:MAG: hypothetical protein A2Y41_06010 [Spirochaetes bacterium GWB1_36_13]
MKKLFYFFLIFLTFCSEKKETVQKQEVPDNIEEAYQFLIEHPNQKTAYYKIRKALESSNKAEKAFEYLKKMVENKNLDLKNMFLTSPFFYVGRYGDGWSYGDKSLLVYYSEKDQDEKQIEFLDHYPKQIKNQKALIDKNGVKKEINLNRGFGRKILPVVFQKGVNWVYIDGEEEFVPKEIDRSEDWRLLGVCYNFVAPEDPFFQTRFERLGVLEQIGNALQNILNILKTNPKDKTQIIQLIQHLKIAEPAQGRDVFVELQAIKDFDFALMFDGQKVIYMNRMDDGNVEGKESVIAFYEKNDGVKTIQIYPDRMPGSLFPLKITITGENFKKEILVDSYEMIAIKLNLKKGLSFFELEINKTFLRTSDKKEIGLNYSVE